MHVITFQSRMPKRSRHSPRIQIKYIRTNFLLVRPAEGAIWDTNLSMRQMRRTLRDDLPIELNLMKGCPPAGRTMSGSGIKQGDSHEGSCKVIVRRFGLPAEFQPGLRRRGAWRATAC